tara:strand:+ start:177 stop:1073 length:897 start_codon:yes stop_codon:yes gene_type:complete
MIDSIQAGIAGMIPAGDKLLAGKPDLEFQKTFIPTYKGDSKYGSIMDDYYQSEMFDRDAYFNTPLAQPMISIDNPLFGQMGVGQMSRMGNFNEFLKSNYESMLSQMPAKVVRSQEYMDKFNLYRDAYDKMGFGNPQPTLAPGTAALNPIPQDPGAIQGLLGSGGGANFGPAGPMPNTPGVDYDAQANPFGPQEGVMPEIDNIGLITNAPGYNPVAPQQPTGGFDSKAFANELLTGIGDLFKQHFPESAQMAFNNSNQMQSQIEQPIQDATTFDVQPQQNMAFNPFSVNTLGGSFGGGY